MENSEDLCFPGEIPTLANGYSSSWLPETGSQTCPAPGGCWVCSFEGDAAVSACPLANTVILVKSPKLLFILQRKELCSG